MLSQEMLSSNPTYALHPSPPEPVLYKLSTDDLVLEHGGGVCELLLSDSQFYRVCFSVLLSLNQVSPSQVLESL